MKTDTQVQEEVVSELKWEPSVNTAGFGVEVRDGIVSRVGQASSYAEKWGEERAAQRTSEVKAFAIEMNINSLSLSERNDSSIAYAAESILLRMTYLPKNAIKVMVESGWITLSGEVLWTYQREAAAGAVSYLLGVMGVSDQIVIKSNSSICALKSDIEAALQRRANTVARKISVEVQGRVVTLTGTVNRWFERDLAWHCAWSAPGVRNVVDNIFVSN